MEQNLFVFLFSAVIISLSGVLSPGPMTAAVIQQGGRSRLTGIYVALGHGVVEMPLIFFIFLGASSMLQQEWVRVLIGMAGGIYLLFMGMGFLRSKENSKGGIGGFSNEEVLKEGRMPSSFYSGIFLSIGNPYFLLWWATIGAGLVINSLMFGLIGLILFALFHWLCDFFWYGFLSMASFKGIKMFGAGFYKKISIVCGLAMFFYGGFFIFNSLTQIMQLR
jgi:threonine/homoserine/homoserine lactone efflux protein